MPALSFGSRPLSRLRELYSSFDNNQRLWSVPNERPGMVGSAIYTSPGSASPVLYFKLVLLPGMGECSVISRSAFFKVASQL